MNDSLHKMYTTKGIYNMTTTSTLIGYPYIGTDREWKRALEAYWAKTITEQQFEESMKALRLANIQKQVDANVDLITVGDFTYYDRILDVAAMFGMVPKRYNWDGNLSTWTLIIQSLVVTNKLSLVK